MTTVQSDLTCPDCGFIESLAMPTDACLFFHECRHCRSLLRPRAGDCCVFCSFGSAPCPPIQCSRDAAANTDSDQTSCCSPSATAR
ncbi:MAG: GDCCVxC domain-containing (seleno)protein [Gemmatimonadaceae bacterium]